MKFPLCQTTDLLMTDLQGIEIDYCPQCLGAWLDRGELDKIIERSTMGNKGYASLRQLQGDLRRDAQQGYRPDHGNHHGHAHKKVAHTRKKSIWQEIFD